MPFILVLVGILMIAWAILAPDPPPDYMRDDDDDTED